MSLAACPLRAGNGRCHYSNRCIADPGEWRGIPTALYVGDTDFERLIGLLMEKSAEFSAWWPRQDVVQQPSTVKRIQHPTEGLLEFEYLNLDVTQSPGMRFIVCTPRIVSDQR